MRKNIANQELKCFIFDDEINVRKRLSSLLLKIEGLKIVGSEEATEMAIKRAISLKPDIVFTDVEMPRINGFEVIDKIYAKNCFPTFIFVTGYNQYAIKAIKKAAFDFLLKPVDIDELSETINRYRQNNSAAKKLSENLPQYNSLSEREKEVLALLLDCHTSREIAEILFISKNTVDTHRRNILHKLNVSSTVELFKLL